MERRERIGRRGERERTGMEEGRKIGMEEENKNRGLG